MVKIRKYKSEVNHDRIIEKLVNQENYIIIFSCFGVKKLDLKNIMRDYEMDLVNDCVLVRVNMDHKNNYYNFEISSGLEKWSVYPDTTILIKFFIHTIISQCSDFFVVSK